MNNMKILRFTLLISCLVLLLSPQHGIAQNLVPNPGFDTPVLCPTGAGQISNAAGWSSATDGSADYYDACGSAAYATPANIAGSQAPVSGTGYAGFFAYRSNDRRSYVQTQLSQALTPGKDYCVSFQVSLADLAYVAVEEIGLYFNTAPTAVVNGSLPLNVTPQIEYNGGLISDKNNWTTISGTFTADAAHEWIVIGNFRNNANTTNAGLPGAGGSFFNRAYYYIDEVVVEELPDLNIIATPNSIVCAGSDVTLSATGGGSYTWVAADDPFNVLSNTDQLSISSVSDTRSYILTAVNGICTRQETVTIDVLPQANVNFSHSDACVGYEAYFIDLSAGVYPQAEYLWDLGDGNFAASKGGVTHTYAAAGDYTVSLTLTSPVGCSASYSTTVTVADNCDPCSVSNNYVGNPSMEQYSQCPDTLGQWYYMSNWYSPTNATPDFFHACAAGDTDVDVADNQFGGQTPLHGNGYAGIFGYAPFSYREYISVTLDQPLTPDSVYCISFSASLSDLSGRAIANLGAYVSDNPVLSGTQGPLFVTPQVSHQGGTITNQSGWTSIQGLYVPSTPQQFLTIGNFADNTATNVTNVSGSSGGSFDEYAYYYIDQVNVVPLPKLVLPNDTLQACINETVSLNAPDHFCGYLWYAEDLSANYGTNSSANITSTTSGIFRYVLRAEFDGCYQTDTITVQFNGFPQANFEVLANCAGNVTLLTNTTDNADNNTTYYWDFDSDNTTDISTIGSSNVGHIYTAADTIYQATLIAVNQAGCSDTISIPILVPGTCDPCVQDDNLVLNSDFSGSCPNTVGQIANATLWSSPTTDDADLFAPCGTNGAGIPINDFGNQTPYNGNNYAGFRAYSHNSPSATQEIISQQLFAPLVPGTAYCMKMYVSLAENSDYAIDEVGMYCSVNALDANGSIYQTPQVFNPENVILFDSIGWREISGSFVADSAYQYLSVGNFNWYASGTPNTLLVGSPSPGGMAYYYVDNISISPLSAQVSADMSICLGEQANLSATTTTCTYYWTTLANPSIILSNSLTLDVSPTVTTDYVFYGSNGNCDISDTVRVTVNPLPAFTVSPNISICLGDDATLTASGSNVSYLWSNGSTDTNINVSPTDTTTYGITVTDLTTGCQSAAATVVNVSDLPLADAGNNAAICAGDSLRLSASGGNIFAWQPAPGIDSLNIADPVVRPAASTWYYVVVSNSQTGCSALDSVLITVNPSLSVADTATVNQCAGSTVQLVHPDLDYGSIISYNWSPAIGLDNPNVAQPNASVNGYTLFNLTFTDINGCMGTAHVGVSVTPTPDAGDDVLICSGGSVQLSASSGGVTYSWTPTDGLDNPNIANPIASPTDTTTYYVMVEYPGGSGNCTQIDSVTVNVAQEGFADIILIANGVQTDANGNPIVCENTPLLLQAVGGDTYAWEANGGITTPLDNAIVSVQSATTTTYYVNVSNSVTGCPVRDSITVFIVPNTTPNIDELALAPYYCATFGSPIEICLSVSYDGCENLSLTSTGVEGNFSTSGATANCFFYEPSPTQATDTFTVSLCTDGTLCDQVSIIVVNNICDENAPVWANDNLSAATFEGVPISIDLPSASDPDAGDLLHYSTGAAANGTVVLDANVNATYTPNDGFTGNDQFEVYVCDTYFEVQCDTLVVSVVVNDLPACAEEVQVTCMRPGSALQLCFDFCLLNNPIVNTAASDCNACQTFAGFSPDCIIYVPTLGVQTIDTLYVVANDPTTGYTQTATAIINVGCTQPNAVPDFTGTIACLPVDLDVLANDSAPCDDALFIQLANGGNTANGTASVTASGVVRYQSNAGFMGNDTIFYSACNNCDLGLICAPSFAVVNVQPNQAPTAQDITLTINQLAPVNICIPYNDPEGTPVNTTIVIPPAIGGTFYNFNGNCFSYAPSALLGVTSNNATFVAQICDNCGNCTTANVAVNLAANEPPISQDTTVTTPYNTPIEVCLDVIEPNGDDYALNIISTTANGTVTLVNDSCILFTPADGYSGTTTVDVLVCDEHDACDEVTTITIIVAPAPDNFPPVVGVPATSTPFNTPVDLCLNISDPDGDAIVYPITLSDPDCGTVAADGDPACLTFTPNSGFSGLCSFTATVCDVLGNCTVATINITVNPDTNSAPTVNFPPISTPFNTPIEVCLAVIDPDGDPISYPITVVDPACGEVFVDDNSACFNFTPNVGYMGVCSVTVTVCDTGNHCTTVQVPITVGSPANTPPVVPNQTFTTTVNTPIVICVEATDIDEDILTFNNVIPGSNGSVSNIDDNTLCFTFTPDTDFVGSATVIVQVCDDDNACDSGTITINVQEPANLPPTFSNFTTNTLVDMPVTVCVTDYANDPNGDPLAVTTVGGASNGIANSGTPGDLCFTYTPNAGFVGNDTVDVTVCDPDGLCTVGQVIIVVVAQNNAPIITAVGPYVISPAESISVCTVVSDPEGNPVTVSIANVSPNVGSVTLVPDATCASGEAVLIVPPADYLGNILVTLTACDNFGACTTTPFVVIIVNDTPIINDQTYSSPQNEPITVCPAFSDQINNSITLSISGTPANGTANINAACITYTPANGFIGTDSVLVVLCDNYNACDTATLYFNISDAFIAFDDVAATEDGIPIAIDVQSNDVGSDDIDLMSISDAPNNGTATIVGNNIVYTPNVGFVGTDTFYYVICNNTPPNYGCDTAMVVVNVSNDLNANDDTASTPESTSVNISVQANDAVPASDIVPTVLTEPENGVVISDGSGGFTYLPNAGFTGIDSFTYIISYPGYGSDTATVYITVTPNNTPLPIVANNDAATTTQGDAVTVNVLGNDNNPNGNPMSVTQIITAPANGTATINADGTISYTPNTGFSGTDVFTYQVCDTDLNICATATVTVTVTAEVNCTVLVHGVISPNGDGYNEELVIDGLSGCPANTNNTLTVFNRWGNPVFNADNYGAGTWWNGTWNNGEALPDGTYYYVLDIEGQDIIKGFIEITR